MTLTAKLVQPKTGAESSTRLLWTYSWKLKSHQIAPLSPKLEGRFISTTGNRCRANLHPRSKPFMNWTSTTAGVSSLLLCQAWQSEGVYKSFQMTQEEYGKKSQILYLQLAQLTEIDRFCTIIPSPADYQLPGILPKVWCKDYMKLDEFARRPIDIIAKNKSYHYYWWTTVCGRQTKDNLKQFNPLMTLRYLQLHITG